MRTIGALDWKKAAERSAIYVILGVLVLVAAIASPIFLSGTAIMPFADLKNGKPDMGSLKVVRIREGTRIIIPEGKAHFPPVAEDDTPVTVVVVAPKMHAPRIPLPESILGV